MRLRNKYSEGSPLNAMTPLQVEQCQLTYEGVFVKPAFSLTDSPGKFCDLLLDSLGTFGCTSADLAFEEGEPDERGVSCEIEDLDTLVTLHGDRFEVHSSDFAPGIEADLGRILENLWSGLAGLSDPVVARTHSFL